MRGEGVMVADGIVCSFGFCSSESAESGMLEHYHRKPCRHPCSPMNR